VTDRAVGYQWRWLQKYRKGAKWRAQSASIYGIRWGMALKKKNYVKIEVVKFDMKFMAS